MRVKFVFDFDGKLSLPIHYNHMLQGFLYRNLHSRELSQQYHDIGFQTGNHKYKLFTFSRIFGKYSLELQNKKIVFTPPISLTVSSYKEDFLSSILDTMSYSESLELNGVRLTVRSYEPHFLMSPIKRAQIEMLSPITAYLMKNNNGKKFTQYLSPWDEDFGDQIQENLINKARSLGILEQIDPTFSIKPTFEFNQKFQKVMWFKDTLIKGWYGTYILEGTPELMELAYYGGIGAKNSEGFGCFRIFGMGE